MKKAIIVTNNSLVKEKYQEQYIVQFVEGTLIDVLLTIRNKIHKGHKLLTHPLSGSVKPNETPFKSVLISANQEGTDVSSLMIVESSISTVERFLNIKKTPKWPENILNDFKEIDFTLIDGAIESMRQFY